MQNSVVKTISIRTHNWDVSINGTTSGLGLFGNLWNHRITDCFSYVLCRKVLPAREHARTRMVHVEKWRRTDNKSPV